MPRPVRQPTAKELLAADEARMIRAATKFVVVFFVGRDPREDHGIITQPLHRSFYFRTLEKARAWQRISGADWFGRRGIVRAIYKRYPDQDGGEVGVYVPEGFVP